jgi:hypothetical protein
MTMDKRTGVSKHARSVVERSSFGSASARRLRTYTSAETAAKVVRRSQEIAAKKDQRREG